MSKFEWKGGIVTMAKEVKYTMKMDMKVQEEIWDKQDKMITLFKEVRELQSERMSLGRKIVDLENKRRLDCGRGKINAAELK